MKKRMFALLLIAFAVGFVTATTTCNSDTDCFSISGICPDAIGTDLTHASTTCVCPPSTVLRNNICQSVNGALQMFNNTNPIYYKEQETSASISELRDGLVAFPSGWFCDTWTSSCYSYSDDGSVILFSTLVYDVITNNGSFMQFERTAWRCVNRTQKATLPPFDSSLNPLVTFGGPLFSSAFCQVPITERGTNCTDPGLTGPTCMTNSTSVAASMFALSPVGSTACVVNGDCSIPGQTCIHYYDTSVGARCACGQGLFRALDADGHEVCTNQVPPLETTPVDVIGIWTEWGLGNGKLYGNAISLSNGNWRVTAVAYSEYLNGSLSSMSYSASSMIGWGCESDALYFNTNSNSPLDCDGCAAVCGEHADCVLSDPISGVCECLTGWSGTRCDTCIAGLTGPLCEESNAICDASRCSGNGNCIPASRECKCFAGWYGADCSLPLASCSEISCGGEAFVNSSCVFDTSMSSPRTVCQCSRQPEMFGLLCNQTAEICSTERCSGHGHCVWDSLTACFCPLERLIAPDCSIAQCVNNGTWESALNRCGCQTGFAGTYCELSQCLHGVIDATSGLCSCTGVAVADSMGRCSGHSCGQFGTPNDQWNACVCQRGYSDLAALTPRCQILREVFMTMQVMTVEAVSFDNISFPTTFGNLTSLTNETSTLRVLVIVQSGGYWEVAIFAFVITLFAMFAVLHATHLYRRRRLQHFRTTD